MAFELWTLLEQGELQVHEITTTVDERFSDGRRWLGALAAKPHLPNGATF